MAKNVGSIIIGTSVDNKGLEDGLKDSEKLMDNFDKNNEIKPTINTEELKKQRDKIREHLLDMNYTDALELSGDEFDAWLKVRNIEVPEEVTSNVQEYLEKSINPELDVETNVLYEKLTNVENEILRYKSILSGREKLNLDDTDLIILINKLNEATLKSEKLKQKLQETDKNSLKNVNSNLDKMNTKLGRITKSVGRWAMAVFGVQTAYMFIRQAMTTLSEYNTDLANKIENIKLVLTSALEPVVMRLISLVITLLGYLNYLTKAWFGIDLFARASELSSKKMGDNLKSGAKSAKEINKQLAGFDEMNIMQNNDADTGGGAGGGGAKLPKFELEEGEIPEWLVWIKDHGEEIIAIIAGITAAIIALKVGLGLLTALGIGLMVAGLVYAILGLLDYLKDPTWKNFGKIIQGIGVFVIGLGVAFLGLPAIIVGVVVLIWGTIVKYWDQIKAFLQKGLDWLKGRGDWVRKTFGDTIGNMYDNFVNTLQLLLDWLSRTMDKIKENFDLIISFVKNVFKGNWKAAWEDVKKIFSNIFNSMIDIVKTVFSTIVNLAKNIGISIGDAIGGTFKAIINSVLAWIESQLNKPISAINSLIGVINKVPGINLGKLNSIRLPRLAKGGIVNMPGKGVPIGGAIAGERGAEGVIPLTDSQQMALLGEAIGKYITVNANITNTMNGRVISRELKKIENESDFAFNR